jgi:hypothetical protein
MPKSVDGKILLGWMIESEAVPYLQKECLFDPPLLEQQARDLWIQYRDRVAALPERIVHPPVRHPLPNSCKKHAAAFLQKLKGPEVLDVIRPARLYPPPAGTGSSLAQGPAYSGGHGPAPAPVPHRRLPARNSPQPGPRRIQRMSATLIRVCSNPLDEYDPMPIVDRHQPVVVAFGARRTGKNEPSEPR